MPCGPHDRNFQFHHLFIGQESESSQAVNEWSKLCRRDLDDLFSSKLLLVRSVSFVPHVVFVFMIKGWSGEFSGDAASILKPTQRSSLPTQETRNMFSQRKAFEDIWLIFFLQNSRQSILLVSDWKYSKMDEGESTFVIGFGSFIQKIKAHKKWNSSVFFKKKKKIFWHRF